MTVINRTLEFTLAIGCPINCAKFCPQEIVLKNYCSPIKMLSLKDFKAILDHTPRRIGVIVAGLSEPYLNRDCTEMMRTVLEQGRNLSVYTTLSYMTDRDCEALLEFDRTYKNKVRVQIHLPDGKIMKEPQTRNYQKHFFQLQTGLSNVLLMSMKGAFKSNMREELARKQNLVYKKYGHCDRANECLSLFVLPNGDVYPCCMDFALRHKIGNLLTERYEALENYCLMHEGEFSSCNYCSENKNYLKRLFWLNVEKFRFLMNPTNKTLT